MNIVELQQLKIKAMQAPKGSKFIFPLDIPLDQIAAVISFLKEGIIVIKKEYSNTLIKTIMQTVRFPHQIYLEAGLSEYQILIVCEYATINHNLWLDEGTSVTNLQLITKYFKPYTAIIKIAANFSLMSSLALLSSLKKGCFFAIPEDANPGQIRSILSFVNHGVILALPCGLPLTMMQVINQVAPLETCFFIGKDFTEQHCELVQHLRGGHYCMFDPQLSTELIKQFASFIPAEAGIRMHLMHSFQNYIEILPYLSARVIVYLEPHWKQDHLSGLFHFLPNKAAIRVHAGFSADVCLFAVKNSPVESIIYIPYDVKFITLEYLVGHLEPHSILCMGPQFEYACENFINIIRNMKQGWWMPDPRISDACASFLARNLPDDFKLMLHPMMSAPTALLFSSELNLSIELNIYPGTSTDLLRFFLSGLESKIMFFSNIEAELANKTIKFLSRQACYIPNPQMHIGLSKELLSSLGHFCQVQMPKQLDISLQTELIKSLPEHTILSFEKFLNRNELERMLAGIPETVGIKLPKKFELTSVTYLARNVGLHNIIYLPHNIENLVADLLVLSLRDGGTICLGSHFESEDDLILELMGRNKKVWIMPDWKMPHSRLRYLLNHAPDNFKLKLHPLTELRFAQILGRELKQTIELNIHPQTNVSLLQNFLLSFSGKIILEALSHEQTLEVLRCGHELQLLQLPNQLNQEHFPMIIEALPPTGIVHFQVQNIEKANLVKQLVEQFHADQVLSLADDVPIELYELIVGGIPEMASLYMTGSCRVEKLHIAFRVLKSRTIILLSPDIKEMSALAIIEKMGSRGDLFLMFHPMMHHTLLKKLMASLYPNTKVMLHPNSSEFFLQSFRNSWNTNCILVKHYLMSSEVYNGFLSSYDKPIQILMHPLTDVTSLAESQPLINSIVFTCLSPYLSLDLIKTLAKLQSDEVCITATPDCPEKPILEFMSHLPNPSTIVCHPNISPLQAALVAHNLPANVCLFIESSLSGDSVIELVKNCQGFHTLVVNPKDKESYLNILSALTYLQENVSIMVGPETPLEYMAAILSRINQNCYLVFHPQTPDYKVSQSMKKISPQIKVLLHPEINLKQALTIAFNLTKSKTIYYYPGTSKELIKSICDGVNPHIRFVPYATRISTYQPSISEEKSFSP